MSTCAKRSVLQAGDRPGRVRQAALAVQAAANNFRRRQLPATGTQGNPFGNGLRLSPYQPRQIGLGNMDPFEQLVNAIDGLARDVADTFRAPQGPVGWSGGRNPGGPGMPGYGFGPALGGPLPNGGAGGPGPGGGTTPGTGPINGGGPGLPTGFTEGRTLILDWHAPYTEPMNIPLPRGFRPVSIIASRIWAFSDPARFFRSGVACDFHASTLPNTIVLRSIDGMTVAPEPDPTVLTYTFIYFGVQHA